MPQRPIDGLRSIDDTSAARDGARSRDPLTSLDCHDTLRELLLTLAGIVLAFTGVIALVRALGL